MEVTGKHILVWYFRVGPENGSERTRLSVLESLGIKLTYVNAVTDICEKTSPGELFAQYDGLIILGSSELFFDGGDIASVETKEQTHMVARVLKPYIQHIIQHDHPTLGLCFGHQLIAKTLGATIFSDKNTGKVGTHEIEFTKHAALDSLVADMPPTIQVQYGHKDVIATIPRPATLLAYGRNCHVSMLRYGKHVYTAQFHPELDKKSLLSILKEYKEYSAESGAHQKVQETPYGKQILINFGKKILANN